MDQTLQHMEQLALVDHFVVAPPQEGRGDVVGGQRPAGAARVVAKPVEARRAGVGIDRERREVVRDAEIDRLLGGLKGLEQVGRAGPLTGGVVGLQRGDAERDRVEIGVAVHRDPSVVRLPETGHLIRTGGVARADRGVRSCRGVSATLDPALSVVAGLERAAEIVR